MSDHGPGHPTQRLEEAVKQIRLARTDPKTPPSLDSKLADYQHDIKTLLDAFQDSEEEAEEIAGGTKALEELHGVQRAHGGGR